MTKRDDILAKGRDRFGLPYRLDPPPDGVNNIDCSLYVVLTYRDAGVPFPAGVRTAEQIRQACVPIAFTDVLPGDLLFFEHTYDAGPPSADGHIASHIGMSLGLGTKRMLDANDAKGVGETNINTQYWQSRLFEVRRTPSLVAPEAVNESEHSNLTRGIDVSSHQGAVDWRAVAGAGYAFGFTKATGGTWYRNPTFTDNWLGMKAAGLTRGAYHFAFETSGQAFPGDGPEAEAEYFVAELKRGGGLETGDLLALDIEDGDGPLGEWALRWLKRVEALTGVKALLYSGSWFTVPHGLGSVPELANYKLWLAAYQEQVPPPPAPWTEVAIHQYTDALMVPGISGPVDGNRFLGTIEQLRALGKGGAVTPTTPAYGVGSGLLAMMTGDGTTPIAPSTFLPLGQSPALIEEGYGANGVIYRWFLATGQSFRYRPAA